MGNGPADLQSVWHSFVAEEIYQDKKLLDIGAGKGLSRARLESGGNVVTNQDINRAMMLNVDMVQPLETIVGIWETVTSFDAIEHHWQGIEFIKNLDRLSEQSFFFTTPNNYQHPSPWHYKPEELISAIKDIKGEIRYFGRFKGGFYDFIMEVSKDSFLKDRRIYALGIMISKKGEYVTKKTD